MYSVEPGKPSQLLLLCFHLAHQQARHFDQPGPCCQNALHGMWCALTPSESMARLMHFMLEVKEPLRECSGLPQTALGFLHLSLQHLAPAVSLLFPQADCRTQLLPVILLCVTCLCAVVPCS